MNLRTMCLFVIMFGVLGLAVGGWATDANLKTISGGKMTVSYPAGMDSQAKRVLEIAQAGIAPSLDINQQIIALLGHADTISADIAALLGYQEKQDDAKDRLIAYKQRSEALVQCFSNIRLIKKAEAAATRGVDAGLIQVRYDEEKDAFKMDVILNDVGAEKLKTSYYPVFINADGSIRAEKKISEMAVDFLGSNRSMIIAPVHDTVGYIMTQQLNLYHPFGRWFNEGVAGWITRHVVTKADPKLIPITNDLFVASANSKKFRNKVNLLAWPQTAFLNRRAADFDLGLENAQVQYSIEMITDLLGKTGPQTLPQIMKEVNFNPNADTDVILAAINKATGKDFRPTLMNYVPVAVKDGIESGESKKLIDRAEKLVAEKKWTDVASKLAFALEMTPLDVNTRLNYAWAQRELGDRLGSEVQIFLAGRLLKQGGHEFHMMGEGIERDYVLGRLSIMMGDIGFATQCINAVLDAKPDHADAKRAKEEIKMLEKAAGASN